MVTLKSTINALGHTFFAIFLFKSLTFVPAVERFISENATIIVIVAIGGLLFWHKAVEAFINRRS